VLKAFDDLLIAVGVDPIAEQLRKAGSTLNSEQKDDLMKSLATNVGMSFTEEANRLREALKEVQK
jgi:hypothetical protein